MTHSDLQPAVVEGALDKVDRRSCRRFPATELLARVKIKSGVFSQQWEDIHTADYNKKGLAFITNQSFNKGQELTLQITLMMEMGNIQVNNVKAIVINTAAETDTPEHGANHVGTLFNYVANRHMKSLDTQSQLGRIEGILDRSLNLKLKLSQQ
jgi:hypothetical protein